MDKPQACEGQKKQELRVKLERLRDENAKMNYSDPYEVYLALDKLLEILIYT
mgnify:CR=1 FL=1